MKSKIFSTHTYPSGHYMWLFYPSFFLWGVGMSLNFHLGISGVGYGEMLFLFASVIFAASNKIYSIRISKGMKYYYISAMGFVSFLSLGSLTGTYLFLADARDIAIIFRQVFYSFMLIPIVMEITRNFDVERLFNILLAAVVISCVLNLIQYDFSRFSSLLGQNMLGMHVSILFPYALFLLITKKGIFRLVAIIVLPILVVSAFFSLSKGAWVSFTLSFFVFTMVYIFRKSHSDRGGRNGKILATVILVAFFLIVYGIYEKNRSMVHRYISTEISASKGSQSNEERITSIKSSILIAMYYPFGVGGSHYPEAAELLQEEVGLLWVQPDPHNSFAHALSWSGFLGAILFSVLFFYPLFMLFKYKKNLTRDKYAFYLSLLFGAYFFANTTGGHLTQPIFWFVSALIMSDMLKVRSKAW